MVTANAALAVPDSARNMLETTAVIDSTREAFQMTDGTQDAINIDDLKDKSKLDDEETE
jgi:hypothetical protein